MTKDKLRVKRTDSDEVIHEHQAKMPKRTNDGAGTSKSVEIENSTLTDLTTHLKLIAESLIETQKEAAAAKSTAEEVKATNTALQMQLNSQKQKKAGGYQWKYPGNETQFLLNIEIIATLTQALTALELGNPVEVNNKVHDGIAQLLKRNKCVKMADNSPAGWGLVQEYLGNDIASDEEDEKKIKRAEVAVEKKNKRKLETEAKRGQRGGGRGAGRGRYINQQPGYAGYSHHHHTPQYQVMANAPMAASTWAHGLSPHQYNPQVVQTIPYYSSPANQNTAAHGGATNYPTRVLGPCFYCQGPHLKSQCPELAKKTAGIQARIEGQYQAQ